MSTEFTTNSGEKYAVRQGNSNDLFSVLLGQKLVSQEEMNMIRVASLITGSANIVAKFFTNRAEKKDRARRLAARGTVEDDIRKARAARRADLATAEANLAAASQHLADVKARIAARAAARVRDAS